MVAILLVMGEVSNFCHVVEEYRSIQWMSLCFFVVSTKWRKWVVVRVIVWWRWWGGGGGAFRCSFSWDRILRCFIAVAMAWG